MNILTSLKCSEANLSTRDNVDSPSPHLYAKIAAIFDSNVPFDTITEKQNYKLDHMKRKKEKKLQITTTFKLGSTNL